MGMAKCSWPCGELLVYMRQSARKCDWGPRLDGQVKVAILLKLLQSQVAQCSPALALPLMRRCWRAPASTEVFNQ